MTHTYDYIYELTDRLEEVKKDGTLASLYQYDDNGNRLSVTKSGTTVSGVYDDQDRLESYGDYTYTFTDNGELSSKTYTPTGDATAYEYDVFGNLMTVTLPDTTLIEYVIDAGGRRIGKKIDGVLIQGFLVQRPVESDCRVGWKQEMLFRGSYMVAGLTFLTI